MVFLDPTRARRFFLRTSGDPGLFLSRRLVAASACLGPAVVASVAYVDPGNFAINIASGARFGYRLLWVVLLANLVAMLFQALSAKLGIVTGQSLAGLCRAHLPRPLVWALWAVSEIGAIATDLAEFLGASIGIALLLHLPLLAATMIAGAATWCLLLLDRRGSRLIEWVIAGFVGLLGLCYLGETVLARPDWGAVTYHAVVPWLDGGESLALAAGIVGATVMPHALFLHSSLVRRRAAPPIPASVARLVRTSNGNVVLALALAGLVNMAMVYVAAAVFHDSGRSDVATIEHAYETLGPLLGGGAAMVFLTSLVASGLSSSVVGTLAGQTIMGDFTGWRMPLWARRLATMLPAIGVIAWGVDTMHALVASQIVLSLVLPVPMVALLWFGAQRRVMGTLANARATTLVAGGAALLILTMNALLLLQQAGAAPPL
jgi:manganese transport protein